MVDRRPGGHDRAMTQNDESGATATATPSISTLLRRTREPKMIAGVCAGFGRYTGLDPVLFRVALVVLAFFGGVGAIIYLAGWLFLPADGDAVSPAEALLGRGASSTSAVTAIILLVVGALAVTTALDGKDALLLILAAAGCLYLARRQDRGPAGAAPATALAAQTSALTDTAVLPAAVAPAYAPHGPYVDPYGAPYGPPPPTPAARPAKKRSRLGRIVLSAALLIVGAIAALDRLGVVGIGPAAYLAAALSVIGGGLLVGAWYGRSRGLIVVGLLLCLALAAVTMATHITGPGKGVGTRLWPATTVAEIRPSYDLGVGDATLDLRNVDFTDTPATTTRVHVGIGALIVHVPPNVDVTVQAKTGAGSMDLFGQHSDGTSVHRTVTDPGADGPGAGGTLALSIDNGIGDVEVTRD